MFIAKPVKKKILIVSPYFYPEGGGLENYAFQVAKHCSDYEFHVICLTKGKALDEQMENIMVHRKKANFVVSNTPIRLQLLFEIIRLIKKEKIKLIHAHTPVPFAMDMAAIASFLTRVPIIITYHTAQLYKKAFIIDLVTFFYSLFEFFTLRIAKKIIVVSPHIKEEKRIKKFYYKSCVIFPGVNLDRFEFNKPPHGNMLLFIAPLKKNYPAKGLDVLLKALNIVQKEIANIQLHVVGEKGDALEEYQQQVKNYHLENQVSFLGRVENEKMQVQYAKSDMVIVPTKSNTEGTPTVLLEAGAAGRPVIGSNVAGIPYIIKNHVNGLLCEPNNFRDLAEKILFLLENPEQINQMGQKARQLAYRFDWHKIAQQYDDLYGAFF